MIDISKCEYEESFRNTGLGVNVFYYLYPKDLPEIEFKIEEDTDDIESMCISLSVYDNGTIELQMSPSVRHDDCLVDVDWRDLCYGENYTDETVNGLLEKANRFPRAYFLHSKY